MKNFLNQPLVGRCWCKGRGYKSMLGQAQRPPLAVSVSSGKNCDSFRGFRTSAELGSLLSEVCSSESEVLLPWVG